MEMNHEQQDADKQADHGENVHVHFKTEDVSAHESEIQVVVTEDGAKEVHLGFLQIHHVYDITFPLSHSLGKEVTFEPLENLVVKVKSVEPIEDGHQMIVEFNANREKVMKEKVTLRSAATDQTLSLVFHARVLGKHKGTPSLRNGIHCVRIEADGEDESDWQGF